MPWLFLLVATGGAFFTLNAFLPIRRSPWLLVPSFMASVLASELAAYHLAWQAAAVSLFSIFGGLARWPGYVALALALSSWLGLAYLVVRGRQAGKAIERALAGLIGATSPKRPMQWRRLLIPFPLRLRRDRVIRNVVYARTAGQVLRLDIYRPKGTTGPRPAVVQVHGGGWIVGDKREQGVPLMTLLSDNGFVGFNVNYRLCPGATFPDPLVDIKRAIAWIRTHASEYDVDPSFIAITGGSAGAHLASMVALTAHVPEFQPGFEDADISVQAAVPFYGLYDLAHPVHHPGLLRLLEPHLIKAFLAEEPEKFTRASPIHWISADAPPFFIIHGDRDTLAPVSDAHVFAQALGAVSKQPAPFATIPGAQHAFDVFFSPRSLPVIEGVCDFLSHLYDEHQQSARCLGTHAIGAAPDERAPSIRLTP